MAQLVEHFLRPGQRPAGHAAATVPVQANTLTIDGVPVVLPEAHNPPTT
jgi:hypothetical protein